MVVVKKWTVEELEQEIAYLKSMKRLSESIEKEHGSPEDIQQRIRDLTWLLGEKQ